jgi:hypothetical protein
MEALVLLLGEFLLPFVAVAIGLLLEFVAVGATLLCELVLVIRKLAGRRPVPAPVSEAAPPRPRVRVWLRRARIAVVAAVGLTLLVSAVLQLFFFESAVRWIFGRVRANTGIETTFASASGNLFTGRLEMAGVTVRRAGSGTSDFDFRADRVEADLDVWSLHDDPIRIESLRIVRLRGTYTCVKEEKRLEARWPFRIDRFVLEDARVSVIDRSRETRMRLAVVAERWESRPLRSRRAVFDVFFRSNAQGTVDETPFSIRTAEVPEGRETAWRVTRLPADKLGSLFGDPFTWLTAGTVDLEVRDRWRAGEAAEIHLDWRLDFDGAKVVVPAGTEGLLRATGTAVAAYVDRREGTFDVRFRLDLDADRFESAASLDGVGLWRAAGEGILEELVRVSGASPDAFRRVGSRILDGFKSFLDLRRRGAAQAGKDPDDDAEPARDADDPR